MYNQLVEMLMDIDEAAFGVVEAGWIHPNGDIEELLDYIMGDHDKDAFRKMRPGEYVPEGIPSFPKEYKKYLNQGHIRYLQTQRGFNIELLVKPTSSQMRVIRKCIEEGTGEFFFSIAPSRLNAYGTHGNSWGEFRKEIAKL